MARQTRFLDPEEYIDLLNDFVQSGRGGVKISGTDRAANREDAAVLRMAVFCKELPVEVIMRNGELYLIRKEKE